MDNTLNGKRIVITRAVEQSEAIVKALRKHGAIPVLLPMVAFTPPYDLKSFDLTLRNLTKYDWIFLTSQNALRAMQDRCTEIGLRLIETIGDVKLAAVGPATASTAQSAGLNVEYIAKKHQGIALADELSAAVKERKSCYRAVTRRTVTWWKRW